MSLKIFHLVFIALSILMSLYVGAWGLSRYSSGAGGGTLALGIGCFVLGAALAVYFVKVYRKFKEMGR
ncbi:MAG: hypothetical protein R2991_16145 [Thermoanaerobaculia bacterium]